MTPPLNGLKLWYDMETLTADGKMKDLSGNGNHGTLVGPPSDAAGRVGRARRFSSGSYLTANALSPSGLNMAVAYWINVATLPTSDSQFSGGGNSWRLLLEGSGFPGPPLPSRGKFFLQIWQSHGPEIVRNVNSVERYDDGRWHLVMAVVRNGALEMWVDGSLRMTGPDVTTNIMPSTGVSLSQFASNDLTGTIDEALFYDRAPSAAEIAALWLEGVPEFAARRPAKSMTMRNR